MYKYSSILETTFFNWHQKGGHSPFATIFVFYVFANYSRSAGLILFCSPILFKI